MEDKAVTSPKEMERLKDGLGAEQREVGIKRKELIERLLDLKPPNVTTTLVYEWREDVDKLYEDLGRLTMAVAGLEGFLNPQLTSNPMTV